MLEGLKRVASSVVAVARRRAVVLVVVAALGAGLAAAGVPKPIADMVVMLVSSAADDVEPTPQPTAPPAALPPFYRSEPR